MYKSELSIRHFNGNPNLKVRANANTVAFGMAYWRIQVISCVVVIARPMGKLMSYFEHILLVGSTRIITFTYDYYYHETALRKFSAFLSKHQCLWGLCHFKGHDWFLINMLPWVSLATWSQGIKDSVVSVKIVQATHQIKMYSLTNSNSPAAATSRWSQRVSTDKARAWTSNRWQEPEQTWPEGGIAPIPTSLVTCYLYLGPVYKSI